MKIINYSLFTFILIFFLVSFFYKPKEDRFEKKIETPYEFPEVNLNIPIEKDLSTQGDLSSIIDTSLPQVNFARLWTVKVNTCLLYTSPSPRDLSTSRMPSSA